MLELIPAFGVAVGAGLLGYYVTRLLLERTPLDVEPSPLTDRSRRSRQFVARSSELKPGA